MSDEELLELVLKWISRNRTLLNYEECYGIEIETRLLILAREIRDKAANTIKTQ